jgi:DICT domain-containing protein
MAALSHAIEDESLSRAERPLLFASFQRQRYYRQAERRWSDLAAGAASAAVFADFSELRTPPGGPWEIPVGDGEPLRREWVVACVAAGHAACLAAWEPAAERERAERERRFEAIWTVEPAIVAEAVRTCATIAARHVPALAETVLAHLDAAPVPAAADQLRLAAAITNRTLALVDDGV